MLKWVKYIIFLFFLDLMASGTIAQSCTTKGQNPTTAFPVCGATKFTQSSVPICGDAAIPTLCGGGYSDKNPYWYKFTCFSAGALGFIITPLAANEDYDWQLFDVTGHDPMEVYSNASLYVSSNWAGTYGATGTSANASVAYECGSIPSAGKSTFSTMPNLIAGHQYLLLVSHFTDTQSGYTLSFEGGTASIVDPALPAVKNAYAVCDGSEIVVVMNKKVTCTSLATNGTDFTVTGPGGGGVASAAGNGCSIGFDTDSIILKMNSILSPGTYTVSAKIGTDGNTLTDYCDYSLATGQLASLKFIALQPTPMDSISPVICIKDTLQLVFSKPMNCSTIAADGSDFSITGPAAVAIKSARGVCSNGVSTTIQIILSAPISVNGVFLLKLKAGSDGNTLIDECGQTTPAGASLSFTTQNITTANIQSLVQTGCKSDTLLLNHNGNGSATKWIWAIDSVVFSSLQSPVFISKAFGKHSVQLTVSNGKCSDFSQINFVFDDHTIKANFSAADTLCPSDTLHFTDLSSSNTIAWNWSFGNGNTSTLQFAPAQSYPQNGRKTKYTASLAAKNIYGCADTAYKNLIVLASCYVAVPTAFTPNGDGLNDYLYPLNAFKADNLYFRIFNRYGQKIFETKDWTKKWDGRLNSIPQPSGTYVWTLDYVDRDSGQKISLKGTTVLIR